MKYSSRGKKLTAAPPAGARPSARPAGTPASMPVRPASRSPAAASEHRRGRPAAEHALVDQLAVPVDRVAQRAVERPGAVAELAPRLRRGVAPVLRHQANPLGGCRPGQPEAGAAARAASPSPAAARRAGGDSPTARPRARAAPPSSRRVRRARSAPRPARARPRADGPWPRRARRRRWSARPPPPGAARACSCRSCAWRCRPAARSTGTPSTYGGVDRHHLHPVPRPGRERLRLALVLGVGVGEPEPQPRRRPPRCRPAGSRADPARSSDHHPPHALGRGGLDGEPRRQRVHLPDPLGRPRAHVPGRVEHRVAAAEGAPQRAAVEHVGLHRLGLHGRPGGRAAPRRGRSPAAVRRPRPQVSPRARR